MGSYTPDDHQKALVEHIEQSHPRLTQDHYWDFDKNKDIARLTKQHLEDHIKDPKPGHPFEGGRDVSGEGRWKDDPNEFFSMKKSNWDPRNLKEHLYNSHGMEPDEIRSMGNNELEQHHDSQHKDTDLGHNHLTSPGRQEFPSEGIGGRYMPVSTYVSPEERHRAEQSGDALPGGKFPIRNKSDLGHAEYDLKYVHGQEKEDAENLIEREKAKLGTTLEYDISCPNCGEDTLTSSADGASNEHTCSNCDFTFDVDDLDPDFLTGEENNFNLSPESAVVSKKASGDMLSDYGGSEDAMVKRDIALWNDPSTCKICLGDHKTTDHKKLKDRGKTASEIDEPLDLECTNCGDKAKKKGEYTFPGMACPNCQQGILEYAVESPKTSSTHFAAEFDSDNTFYDGDYTDDSAGYDDPEASATVNNTPIKNQNSEMRSLAHSSFWTFSEKDDEDSDDENLLTEHNPFPVDPTDAGKEMNLGDLEGEPHRVSSFLDHSSERGWGYHHKSDPLLRHIDKEHGGKIPTTHNDQDESSHSENPQSLLKGENKEGEGLMHPKVGGNYLPKEGDIRQHLLDYHVTPDCPIEEFEKASHDLGFTHGVDHDEYGDQIAKPHDHVDPNQEGGELYSSRQSNDQVEQIKDHLEQSHGIPRRNLDRTTQVLPQEWEQQHRLDHDKNPNEMAEPHSHDQFYSSKVAAGDDEEDAYWNTPTELYDPEQWVSAASMGHEGPTYQEQPDHDDEFEDLDSGEGWHGAWPETMYYEHPDFEENWIRAHPDGTWDHGGSSRGYAWIDKQGGSKDQDQAMTDAYNDYASDHPRYIPAEPGVEEAFKRKQEEKADPTARGDFFSYKESLRGFPNMERDNTSDALSNAQEDSVSTDANTGASGTQTPTDNIPTGTTENVTSIVQKNVKGLDANGDGTYPRN